MKPVLEKSSLDLLKARYPPYNHGKIKLMNLLSKNSSISTGDLIKGAYIASLIALFFILFRFSSWNEDNVRQNDL